MIAKTAQRLQAIKLRRKGFSYSEIRKLVPVSKSSLSLWLPKIHLEKWQTERLRSKLLLNQKLGAEARRKQRLAKIEKIRGETFSQISNITRRELFYMGLMLYWGEGAKQKGGNTSQQVSFSNSDPLMCKLFLKWVISSLSLPTNRVVLRIYIHESQKKKENDAINFWSKVTGFPTKRFSKTCFTITRYPRNTKHANKEEYYGQLRINIARSTDLNRKIAGWIEGICHRTGVSVQNGL